MLYHVSDISGIKVLKPKLSSHGKAWVYAVDNLVTGLLFGTKQDDFDFLITEDDAGKPVVYECYPKALEMIYRGKQCFAYELAEDGFVRGKTEWKPELVCEHEVPVLNEITVDDLYQRLMDEETDGNLAIHRYKANPAYKKIISEHIIDRLIRFDAIGRMENDKRGQTYYRGIINALKAAMDGHLL